MGSAKQDVIFSGVSTAPATSSWIPVAEFETFVLVVSGMVAGDILQLWGTNDPQITTAPTNEEQIGDDITEDGVYQISVGGVPSSIRMKFTDDSGGGTITVKYNARR